MAWTDNCASNLPPDEPLGAARGLMYALIICLPVWSVVMWLATRLAG